MSKTIDDRVVRMQFDNSQFESAAYTSMSTLDRLKEKLNFEGTANGLSSINNSINKVSDSFKDVDTDYLNDKVVSLMNTFNKFGIVGVSALLRIGNMIVDTGTKMVKSLTLDPITQGFQEYETQMNAVQTILANTQSKGSTLKDVNAALDELNEYADKTIYNFTEMTRNIGTFTAAGIGLEESTQAIKGVANLAAVSGSSSEQASRAMYQLSQALAAGKVNLQDWNSVVNAGMGGEVFQEALKRTSRMMGTGVDAAIKKYGTFRESISKTGWLTKEVLSETLAEISGAFSESELRAKGYSAEQAAQIMQLAQTAEEAATKVKTFTQLMDTIKEAIGSGWSQTFRTIIGDFEQAKELYTSISDYFGKIIDENSKARNNMLQSWATWGGRTALIDSVKNAFQGLLSVLRPISEAFHEVIPPMTGENLYYLTVKLRDLAETFKITDETAANIKSTFSGVFSLMRLGVSAVANLMKFLPGIASTIGVGIRAVLKVTAVIGDLVTTIVNAILESTGLSTAFHTVLNLFNSATKSVNSFCDSIDHLLEPLNEIGEKIKEGLGFQNLISFLGGFGASLGRVLNLIGDTLHYAFAEIGNIFTFESFSGLTNLLATSILAGTSFSIKKFLDNVTEAVGAKGGILNNIKDVINNGLKPLKDVLEEYQNTLKAEVLKKLATAIALLAGALFVIAMIDSEKLSGSVAAISALFVDMGLALLAMGKIEGPAKAAIRSSAVMIPLATSILILAGALKTISEINPRMLGESFKTIEVLTGSMMAFSVIMSKYGGNKATIKSGLFLLALAESVKLVADACVMISKDANPEDILLSSLIVDALIITMASMTAFASQYGGTGANLMSAMNIAALAGAIWVIVDACMSLSKIEPTALMLSFGVIEAFLASLGLMTTFMSAYGGDAGPGAAVILALAGTIRMLAETCKVLAEIPLEDLLKATSVISVLMLAVTSLLAYTGSKGSTGIAGGIGFIAIAASIMVLVEAIKAVVDIDPTALLIASGAIITLLTMIAGMSVMAKDALAGGAAIALISSTMILLAGALKVFSSIPLDALGLGLLALGGSLGIIVGVAAMAQPIIPALLGLAGAVALIGVGTMGVGAGLLALSAGITALAATSTVAIGSVITNISMLVTGLIGLLPLIVQALANSVVTFIETIAKSGDRIAKAFVELIGSLRTVIPSIVDNLMALVSETLSAFAIRTPEFIGSIIDIIIGIIDGVHSRIPDLVDAAVLLVVDLFGAVIDSLKNIGFEGVAEAILGVGAVVAFLAALGAVTGLVPAAMLGVIALSGLVVEIAAVIAAFGAIKQIPGVEWLISEGGDFLQTIGTAIGQFIGGIIGGTVEGASSTLETVGTNLANFMTKAKPFFDTLAGYDPSIVTAAADIFTAIVQFCTGDIAPNPNMTEFGEQLGAFAPQLTAFANSVKEMGEDGLNAITQVIPVLTQLMTACGEISNSGGLVSLFAGDNTPDEWGQQLKGLGTGLSDFATSVEGTNVDAILAAIPAMQQLVATTNEIGNTGGVVALWEGDNDLRDWGAQLKAFGKCITDYADSIKTINPEKLSVVTRAIDGLVNLGIRIYNNQYGAAMDAFSSSLVDLGDDITDFARDTKNIGEDTFNNIQDAIKNLVGFISEEAISKLRRLGDSLGKVVTGYNEAVNKMKTASTNIVNSAITTLSGSVQRFTNMGKTFASTLSYSFSDAIAKTDYGSYMNPVLKAIEAKRSDFETSGGYLAEGLSRGFNNKIESVKKQAVASANAILFSINNTFGVNSPAKETIDTGMFLMLGLAKGITSFAPVAVNAGTVAATATLGAMASVVNEASTVDLGKSAAERIAEGLTENKTIKEALRDKLSGAYDESWFNKFTKRNSKDIYARQEQLRAAMMANLENSEYGEKLAKEFEKVNEATFKASSKWIEKNTNNIFDKYEQWIKVQNRYIKGTQQRSDAEKIVSELEEKMYYQGELYINSQTMDILEQIDAWEQLGDVFQETSEYYKKAKEQANSLRQESFDFSKTWIEKQIEESNRSAIKQYTDWHRVRNRFGEDTDQYKEANENIKQLTDTIKNAVKDLETQRTDILKDALEQRIQYEQDYADNVEAINKQLSEDIQSEWDKYDQQLASQTKSLYNAYGLFDDVGSQTYVSKDALTERLNNQLNAFKDWTNDMDSLADRGLDDDLLKELEDMGPSSANFIKALTEMSDTELDNYVSLWEEKNELAKDRATYQLEDLRKETEKTIRQLRADADEELTELADALAEDLQKLNEETLNSIQELVKNFNSVILGIDADEDSAFVKGFMDKMQAIGEANQWQEEGGNIAQALAEGLVNESSGITDNLDDMVDDWLSTINEKLGIDVGSSSEFYNLGQYCMEGFLNGFSGEVADSGEDTGATTVSAISAGMKQTFGTVINSAKEVATNVVTEIQNSGTEFTTAGEEIINKIISGFENRKSEVTKVLRSILRSSVDLVTSFRTRFYKAGKDLVEGFADGIDEYTFKAEAKAAAMAKAALEAAREELDEHSPSRAFAEVGRFAVLGFANAITDDTPLAEDAGRSMGDSVISALRSTFDIISDLTDDILDREPVITPVVDLTRLEEGYGLINGMLNNTYGLNLAGSIQRANAARISGRINTSDEDISQASPTYNFTQNNYSPKALSRIDIYRQTKNQFAMMKGATGNV